MSHRAARFRWNPMVLLLLLAAILPAVLLAEEPAVDAGAQAAQAFQAYAQASAAEYVLRAESAQGRKLVLRGEPILRWTNPLGGRKAHGDVFVWTDEGRPAAVLSLYEYTTLDGVLHEHHEFCSLATQPLAGEGPEARDWSPANPGVVLAPLDEAPSPAGSKIRRLSQMRDLAERFTAEKTTREDHQTRDLRLLTQPVIRYDSKTHGVTDGALFALVEATDPEIFLLIEARLAAGKPQWQFALARMNSLQLAASYQDKPVWEGAVLPWGQVVNRADASYMIFVTK